MPVSIGIGLEEDGAGCVFGSISGDSKGSGKVWKVKDRFREEEAFQGVEGGLTRGSPIPSQIFLGKVD